MVIIYYNYLFKKQSPIENKQLAFNFNIFGNGLTLISQNNTSLVRFTDYPKVKAYGAKKNKNASMFQGNKKTKKYLEDWYFKMVSKDEKSILSVIPGISISDDGSKKHTFIQIINGKTAKTEYINFPIEDFYYFKQYNIRISNL